MNFRIYRFVKVNPLVYAFVGNRNRLQLPDGNYLLSYKDLRIIDREWMFDEESQRAMLANIGAVMLSDPQAAREQNGLECAQLPMALDPRFAMPAEPEPAPDTVTDGETDNETDNELENGTDNAPDNAAPDDGPDDGSGDVSGDRPAVGDMSNPVEKEA